MGFSAVLDLLVTLLPIVGVGVLLYFCYTNEKVRSVMTKALRFAPFLWSILAAKIPDKKGVFDSHDVFVLFGRLSNHIQETLADPTNVSFDDVQDDLFDFVSRELDTYRAAGVKSVPDVSDESIRTQVKVVFEAIQRAFGDEDSAGDDSSD
jgi:hypothetical protein